MTRRSIYIHRQRVRTAPKGGPKILTWLVGSFSALIVTVVLLVVGAGVVSAGVALSVYNSYVKDLPDPSEITKTTSEQFKTTRIYDRTGQVLLYELFDPLGGNRTHIPLTQIPQDCINATVALEDRNFWTNSGVDFISLGRAFLATTSGTQVQGASTITQQLVKNTLIPVEERNQALFSRKIKEVILATEISRRYSKEQVLEWYLNTNFYGNVAYGLEAAADTYFGKHAQDLTLSECATLAEVPNSPAYNPLDNPDKALERRDIALAQMVKEGYITPAQADAAKKDKLNAVQKTFDIKAPHFSVYVRQQLEKQFGPDLVNKGGLTVYTTLDYDMYQMAQQVAQDQVKKLTEEKRNVTNASVVVIRQSTGEIMALVGSVDYFNRAINGQVNIANAPRQPGSSFKMFNYLTAFMNGYSPATVVYDVRTSFDDLPNPPYTPENYDRKYHGPVTLRTALGSSFNISAVKVEQLSGVKTLATNPQACAGENAGRCGVSQIVKTAHRLGITTLDPSTGGREKYGLALTLGGGEVTLLDMTYAYGVIANGGIMAGTYVAPEDEKPDFRRLDPVVILKVLDSNGQTIYEYKPPQTAPLADSKTGSLVCGDKPAFTVACLEQIVPPQYAYLITDVLSDNNARAPAFGVNSILKLSRPAAVKTGTTSDWKDNWTMGYTPDYTVGVWVGNADNHEMEHISGITGAAPIWAQVMENIEKNVPVHPFVEPPGMVHLNVCAGSGLLPTSYCPAVVKEIFIRGNEPKDSDNVYKPYRLFRPNGKLATAFDPPEQVDTVVFPVYPPEVQDWARENNIPQPPTEFDTTYSASAAGGALAILSPAPYSYVKGNIEVKGNVKIGDLDRWRVAFGEGLDPTQWTEIGSGGGQVDNGTLAQWNVSGMKSGLYTVQLTALDHSGGPHVATAQVTVDNNPPKVDIINPGNGDQFQMERDEWISVDVGAVDDFSMGKVDFYLDDHKVGSTTVSPFSLKWTIAMQDSLSNTLRSALDGGPAREVSLVTQFTFTQTQTVDGKEYKEGDTITKTLTAPIVKRKNNALIEFTNGFSATLQEANPIGYTETHTIWVRAFDAAGNSADSTKIKFFVSHKPPDQNKPTGFEWWQREEFAAFRDERIQPIVNIYPLLQL